jgi:dihydroorotate dehydrogenase
MTLARLAFPVLRPLLHTLDAESAHRLTVRTLSLAPEAKAPLAPSGLEVDLLGLRFSHPLGLAAGFDKNGEVPDQMLAQGLSFVEVGTVTPYPQSGNPRPRLFRLAEDQAIINRMGFNNQGHEALRRRLVQRRNRGGIVGVNIGANKDASDRIGDYVEGLKTFAGLASYVTVNISSPNTPGLRDLQGRDELRALIGRLNDERARINSPPLLVKIAPDLSETALDEIADTLLAMKVDGIIVSNTTVARPKLRSPQAAETGGLSGPPLFALSTRALARLYLRVGRELPLIGVGGIDSADTAWQKIEAGASLLQLYSALVYKGPALVSDIVEGLSLRRKAAGVPSLSQIVGRAASAYQNLAGT